MRYTFLLGLVFCLISSCNESKSTNQSLGASTANSSAPNQWSNSNLSSGISLKVSIDLVNDFAGGDFDTSNHNPVEQMMKKWNNTTSSYSFFEVPAQTSTMSEKTSLSSYQDSEMGIYKHTEWFSNVSSSALAITQFFGLRRNVGSSSEYVEMIHADIIINYKNYNFSTDANSVTTYDLNTVVLHELGHFIGLGHSSSYSTNAVMLPSLAIFESKRTLTTHDTSLARNNYGVSSISAGNTFVQGFSSTNGEFDEDKKEGDQIRGVIELMADGSCNHYIDDKLVTTH